MCDGAEGLANVGGVGDVAMGGEEDGADALGVGSVAVWGVGGVDGAGRFGGAHVSYALFLGGCARAGGRAEAEALSFEESSAVLKQ